MIDDKPLALSAFNQTTLKKISLIESLSQSAKIRAVTKESDSAPEAALTVS